jgi:hypothetical protein
MKWKYYRLEGRISKWVSWDTLHWVTKFDAFRHCTLGINGRRCEEFENVFDNPRKARFHIEKLVAKRAESQPLANNRKIA